MLKSEIAELKERIHELEQKQKNINYVEELSFNLKFLSNIIRSAQAERQKSEIVYAKMRPSFEAALRLLKLPTTSKTSFDEVKRAYRDEAKAHHPDLGGDAELFIKIKSAYELLKGELV